MSSYHDSFSYKNKNSLADMNLIITSFEPDEGFTETFLSMDSIFEENFDGTRNFSYGARYNSVAQIKITMIKKDRTELSLKEFRKYAQWLTGARVDSWMDMYIGPNIDKNGNCLTENIVYSFLGKITDLQQYKMDGRTIGLQVIFSSVTPWAFSQPLTENRDFGQKLLVDGSNYLYAASDECTFIIDDNGILHATIDDTQKFCFVDENIYDGVISLDNTVTLVIDNPTDDLYTYINLDMKLTNENSDYLSIKNKYCNFDDDIIEEETEILNMKKGEIIFLSSEQFITSEKLAVDTSVNTQTVGEYFIEDATQVSSYKKVSLPTEYQSEDANGAKILYYQYKLDLDHVFGDDFNFVWPKLAPGLNEFAISGSGSGNVQFTYRYPMKVGDCTMDIITVGSDIACDDYLSGNGGNSSGNGTEFNGTIAWENVTGKPDNLEGYLIDDEVYTKQQVDDKLSNITVGNVTISEEELNELLANALG